MTKLLLISFDAVGDNFYERLLQYPHFSSLAKQATTVRNVNSVFLTNTYPVHTSIVTGVEQYRHKLINNTNPFPQQNPRWNAEAAHIKAETLWQAAAKKGMETAAVLWPVTAQAKEIRYNIPEVLPRPGKSQLTASLAAGSKRLQAKMFLRHRHLLDGIRQPARDNFAVACMADVLQEYRPGLALMHFTCFDSLCHQYGPASRMLTAAFEALDRNLGLLLAAINKNTTVLLFSDHSQLAVHTVLAPNEWLQSMGLIGRSSNTWLLGETGCFIECCGGSAFFHAGVLEPPTIEAVRQQVAQSEGFARFLRPDEMQACGRPQLPFGFCAQPGYCYEAFPTNEKGNHGYPADYENYQVFYMARSAAFPAGKTFSGGSLLDITPLAAEALDVSLPHLQQAKRDFGQPS